MTMENKVNLDHWDFQMIPQPLHLISSLNFYFLPEIFNQVKYNEWIYNCIIFSPI
jgi:hypothetical protein